MASSKEYLQFILEQLSDLEEIKHKLDMIQESVKSGVFISEAPVEETQEPTTDDIYLYLRK